MRAIPREVNGALLVDAASVYAFGLWCADAYVRSSSIGLSNVEPELVLRFASFLSAYFPRDRLCLRVYAGSGSLPDPRVCALADRVAMCRPYKMKRVAYHVYVNSRPMVRALVAARMRACELVPDEHIGAYLAGRFDGDGCLGRRLRIAYTTRAEAEGDRVLLGRAGFLGTSVLHYRSASEYCIYVHAREVEGFLQLICPYSWKATSSFHPVETAMAPVAGKLPNL